MHPNLQELHPSWEKSAVPGSVLMEFRNAITITNEEETKMRIPENYQGYSGSIAQEVYDVRRLNQLPTIHDSTHSDSPQKPRRTRRLLPLHIYLPFCSLFKFNNTVNDSDDVFVDFSTR